MFAPLVSLSLGLLDTAQIAVGEKGTIGSGTILQSYDYLPNTVNIG